MSLINIRLAADTHLNNPSSSTIKTSTRRVFRKAFSQDKGGLALESLCVYLVTILVLGVYTYARGQDLNWDQKNYHFYSGWALHDRLTSDLFAVGMQTYLNHDIYLIFYHLITSFKPIVAAVLLSSIHALNAPLIYILARLSLQNEQPRLRIGASALACLVGLRSPMFLSEVGSSFTDILSAIPVLIALILGLFAITKARSHVSAGICAVIAGLLLGSVAAMKLVNLVYAISFLLSLICCYQRRKKVINLFACALFGVVFGFTIFSAHLMLVLWREFHNPLFPFYNGLFKSPFWIQSSFSDVRWIPKSFLDGLSYPFQWVIGIGPSNEIPFQDTRFAMVFILVAAGAVIVCVSTFDKGYLNSASIELSPPRLVIPVALTFVMTFFVSSFAIWLFQFGVQRYMIPLELLSGVMLFLITDFLISPKVPKLAVLVTISLVGATAIKIPDWGHVPWQAEWYSVHIPPTFALEDSLYVVVSEPLGYLFPFLPKSSRIVRVLPKSFYGDKPSLYLRTQSIIRRFSGKQRYLLISRNDFDATRQTLPQLLPEWGLRPKLYSCISIPTRPEEVGMCMVEPLAFNERPDDIAHLGFLETLNQSGRRVSQPLSFGKAFSVELLLTAAPTQKPRATILSNHPGTGNFRGLFIESANSDATFRVGIGSGSDWMSCGSFALPPYKKSYLALVLTNQRCSLYLNGLPLPTYHLRTAPANSDSVMTLGNWGTPDRMFSGNVEEIRLSNGILSEDDIYRTEKTVAASR